MCSSDLEDLIKVNGHWFRKVNAHKISYRVSNQEVDTKLESLLDRGANGGFAGRDVRVLGYPDRHADVVGIEDHKVKDLKIGTVAGVLQTQKGLIVGIFHEYAISGKGNTIHSAARMEYFQVKVDDWSDREGVVQRKSVILGCLLTLKNITGGEWRFDLRDSTLVSQHHNKDRQHS